MSTMPLAKNFRENLRRTCEEKKISQAELARRSGVHFVTICRIFAGDQEPSLDVCERLARAAGMRPDASFLEPERAVSKI